MAKTSSIEKNNKRKRLSKQLALKRAKLKAIGHGPVASRSRSASRRSSSSLRCRATRPRTACTTAAKSPAVRVATTASSR